MKDEIIVLGMMSGTSLDGLDLCLARFHKMDNWQFEVLTAETRVYSVVYQEWLSSFYELGYKRIHDANLKYGAFLAEQAFDFISRSGYQVDLIGSHGHTIIHQPELGKTVQIGDGNLIAKKCGIPVITDFRIADVKLGGQGAPLVPMGDEFLFNQYDACLNLGGFSNISLKRTGKRIAFDICPVNMLLNQLAKECGVNFDEDGNLAAQGKVDVEMLRELEGLAFYSLRGPKSLGREWFQQELKPVLDRYDLSTHDKLRTAVEHIGNRLADIFDHFNVSQVLITGGGVRNSFLLKLIEAKTSTSIIVPEDNIIDFKEALIFGFLAVLRQRNEINILASVTGATSDHSSGTIHLP